jgi:thiazole synthase
MAFASCLFTTVCCTAALLVPHGVPPGRRPRAPVRSGGTLVAVGAAPPAVIVGGGIAGLSTALELAGRGFEVTVLSRDASAAATYAAGGMLAPQSERLDGDSPLLGLAVAARDYYPGWVRSLEAASGVDVGLCASGGFLAPAMDGDVVHRWRPPAAGGTSLWLDRPAAAAMEPLLAPEAVGGWWFPQDMSVDPRAVHKALLSACAAAGVMVREGSAAVALELAPHGGSVRAVRLADGTVMPTPGPLVIANGAWTRELLPVPLQPIKGQMLTLMPPPAAAAVAAPAGRGALRRVLFGEQCYIIPRRDGRVVVGGTVEPEAGFDTRVTAGGIAQVLSAAVRLVPALAEYTLTETWAGLRPCTPDLLPLLGPTPWTNVHLAAGYHRNGILLSPLCAKLVADSIEGRLTATDAELLRPFEWTRFLSGGTFAAPATATVFSVPAPAAARPPLAPRVAPTTAVLTDVLQRSVRRPEVQPPTTTRPDVQPSASASPTTTPTAAPAAPATRRPAEVAGGEDRGEQPYYDPDSDVGASIRWAMRANKDFIAQLEQGIEPKYGQARPDAAGAAPGGSSAGAASGSVVEEAQEALPTSLPGMADGARLWIVREGEPLPVPIFEGSPPQEFLAGYGDTVLPRPNPTEAPSRGTPPSATSTRRPPPPPLSPAPPAPSWAVPERAAVAMPAAADVPAAVPAAVNGKAMPTEQPSGFWAQMFKRPVNGVPVNGVPVNGVAAPVHGADAVASAPTAVATASAPEAKRWALPTMTPPPNAPPPPASDDAIHSTDGYAELTSQDQSHATRDAVIKSARAANKRFREMVLEENDDSALQALIEADLAKYRRGESPNV